MLITVLELHPEHLTTSELVLKLARVRKPSEEESIRQAISDLKRSGLLRLVDEIVQPTHAAVCAAGLLL